MLQSFNALTNATVTETEREVTEIMTDSASSGRLAVSPVSMATTINTSIIAIGVYKNQVDNFQNGEEFIVSGFTGTLGGISASNINGTHPIQSFTDTGIGQIMYLMVNLAADGPGPSATSTQSLLAANIPATLCTFNRVPSMPANALRFFVENNIVYVRYNDGTTDKKAQISITLNAYSL